MATSIQKSSTFDVNTVQFSKFRKNKNGGKAVYLSGAGGSKIQLQFPYMRAPFGLSTFTDEASKKTSYSLDLSFDVGDPEIEDLSNKLKTLDDIVTKTVADNSTEWLGKKYNLTVIKEALYKPLVRPGKGEYPGTVKLKILTDAKTGNFVPEAYNLKREEVPLTSIEKGHRMMAIVEVSQIWFIDNKFGISVRLLQCLLEPSKKLPKFAFQLPEVESGSPEEEEYEEGDEEEVDA
jgi:hypothetical protein